MSLESRMTRRGFLGHVAAGAIGAMAAPQLAAMGAEKKPGKRTATDLVRLGKSGVKVTRLGMGTGSNGGSIQRAIGQEEFTRVIRHGIERGITFIDTADNYRELHEMIRSAIKGLDREKLQIQCKIPHGKYEDPLKEIDRFRKEIGTDYFDSFLIHCVRTATWPEEEKRLRDLLSEAKEKQIIRSMGVSMHGLLPLRATVETDWGDVRFIRINHNGTKTDGLKGDWNEKGNVEAAVDCVRKIHAQGKGVIAMKLIGNGDFTKPETRQASIDFVMGLGCVDAAVIGFKSPAEIDEAIERINSALAKEPQIPVKIPA